jgi:hypothetical protein
MTPHGTVFAQPVELRIPIDTAAAAGPACWWSCTPTRQRRLGCAAHPEGGERPGGGHITSFSFYKVVKITGMVLYPAAAAARPARLEMSMTLGGAAPSAFTWVHADGTPQRPAQADRSAGCTAASRTGPTRCA